MKWARAFAAAGVSVFLPGAGHALLRDWRRAALFGLMYLSAVLLFLPSIGDLAAADSTSEAISLATTELDVFGQFALSFVVFFAAVDAGFRALGFPPGSDHDASGDTPGCPECGRELDADLTFCHWCTARLEPPEADEEEEEPVGS